MSEPRGGVPVKLNPWTLVSLAVILELAESDHVDDWLVKKIPPRPTIQDGSYSVLTSHAWLSSHRKVLFAYLSGQLANYYRWLTCLQRKGRSVYPARRNARD